MVGGPQRLRPALALEEPAANPGTEERVVWALRAFGWSILAIGVLSLLIIPYLVIVDRDGETPQAIAVGLVGIVAGLLIVRFVTTRER